MSVRRSYGRDTILIHDLSGQAFLRTVDHELEVAHDCGARNFVMPGLPVPIPSGPQIAEPKQKPSSVVPGRRGLLRIAW